MQAQDILKKPVNLHIDNLTMLEVLTQLEKIEGVSFSYDRQIISKHTLFNSHIKNTPLEQVLQSFLPEVSLNYKLINEHIVLYYYQYPEEPKELKQIVQTRKELPSKVEESRGQRVVPAENVITIYDTVVYTIHDTIFEIVYDTFLIEMVDTVTYYDTVRIHIEPEEKQAFPKNTPKYSMGLHSGMVWPKSQSGDYPIQLKEGILARNSSSYEYIPTWNAGIFFEDYFQNFFLRIGLQASSFRILNHFNYQWNHLVSDTIIVEHYYEIDAESDTTWIDVTDIAATQAPDSNQQNIVHNYFYLQVPIELGYNYHVTSSLSLGVLGGVQGAILLGQKKAIPESTLSAESPGKPATVYLSLTAGVQLYYKIPNNIRIGIHARYKESLNTSLDNVSINLSINKAFY